MSFFYKSNMFCLIYQTRTNYEYLKKMKNYQNNKIIINYFQKEVGVYYRLICLRRFAKILYRHQFAISF